MSNQEKRLLLKDLCARLPYKLRVKYVYKSCLASAISGYSDEGFLDFELLKNFKLNKFDYCDKNVYNIVPYLRPMSSMTDEEKLQLVQYACIGEDMNGEFIDEVERKNCHNYIDWINEHHFDYRGLIEKGLALEASEGMYKQNSKIW